MRTIVIAFAIGCAAAPSVRAQWDAYCCVGGTVADPKGCRAAERDGLEACVEAGGWAMECRAARPRECSGSDSNCFCCREAGQEACSIRMRTARVERPRYDPPPEPPVDHRRSGRIWSPF
jgi:hypothetical protein